MNNSAILSVGWLSHTSARSDGVKYSQLLHFILTDDEMPSVTLLGVTLTAVRYVQDFAPRGLFRVLSGRLHRPRHTKNGIKLEYYLTIIRVDSEEST